MQTSNRYFPTIVLTTAFFSCFLIPALAYNRDAAELFRQAMEFRFTGNTDAAIISYRRGLNLDPANVQGHDQLGLLLLQDKGDLDGAISEFMTALQIEPSCESCQLHLNQAVDISNAKAPDLIVRGNQFYITGDNQRAVAYYRLAVHADPNDASAHNSLAWVLYKQGAIDEGLTQIHEAMKLQPDDPEFVNTLACLLFEKGEVSAAAIEWHKAISLSQKPGAADLYGLALASLANGNEKDAVKYFNDAVAADPKFTNLAYIRDQIGMSVHALGGHEKLVSLAAKGKKNQ